jgi:hypothetical protein
MALVLVPNVDVATAETLPCRLVALVSVALKAHRMLPPALTTTGKRPPWQFASTYPEGSCAETDVADTGWLLVLETDMTPDTKKVNAGLRCALTVYCTTFRPS